MKVEMISVEALKPYEKNARLHSEEQLEQIRNSVQEFGFKNPVLIDENNMILAGHGRVEAVKNVLKEVPCIRYTDLNEAQKRAYILADNKISDNAGWDLELLNQELMEIQELDDIDLSKIGFELDEITFDDDQTEIIEDEVPELPVQPKSKPGEIYKLGNHRLMCGDSTNEDDVAKLMDGTEVDLLITDPPYNVDYVGKTSEELTIKNDSMTDESFLQFLTDAFENASNYMRDGASFYVWYASRNVSNFIEALNVNRLEVRQELIWNKNSMVLGRQDYQWKHEPCLYGWKATGSHEWFSDRKQTTVIDYDRPSRSEMHPTMKPVGLFDYQIKNSSKKGAVVLDLFGGSGTTLIACEYNGRRAFMMEYDAGYVDVIIERWEALTNEKAIKL